MSVENLQPNDGREKPTQKPAEKKEVEAYISVESKMLEDTQRVYLQAERDAEKQGVQNDIEFSQSSIPASMGYIPVLEALLKEVRDADEWTDDSTDEATKEQTLLQNASVIVRNNLQEISQKLSATENKNDPSYQKLRTLYVQRSTRLTELVGCIDDTLENTEIRDGQLAARQAMDTIRQMTTEESIDWVQKTMSSIDSNNWQSSGLKEAYGLFANACKQGLKLKLAEAKQRASLDPKAMAVYVKQCMEVAQLFTDRGSPIDSNLCDIGFAAEMAKQAMGFEELALQYAANTLNKPNPLSQEVNAKRGEVLAKIRTLPETTQRNPQVMQLQSRLIAKPLTVEGYAQQYAIIRSLERMFAGEETPFDPNAEIQTKLAPVLESAIGEFATFLNGSWGGAASLKEINAAIGYPGMNADQIAAWNLLSDIEGYGYDVSDNTWGYVNMGARIAAMIATGVAVGIATGGLGVVAAALSGGATMTVTGAVMNQQGFDTIGEGVTVYGKDMAINTATMGVSRYLAAGRVAFQTSRAGAANSQSVKEFFRIAGERGGMRALSQVDDAAGIGTRIMGATLEGTADTLIGTSLDTMIQGGSFVENLQNNAMFMGLGYADLGGAMIRKIRGLPDEELQGLAQIVNKAGLQQEQLRSLCNEVGVDAKAVFAADNVSELLKNASNEQKKAIGDACNELKETRKEFEETLKNISNKPEQVGDTDAAENLDDAEQMKQTIMALPDTPEGFAKRIEAAMFLLNLDASQMTDAMRQAVIDAHNVPMSNGMEYSMTELVQKVRILEKGGFTRGQADTLLRMGVCGSPPPPPPGGKLPSDLPDPKTSLKPKSPTPSAVPKPTVGPKPPPPPPAPRKKAAPNIEPKPPPPPPVPSRTPAVPNTPATPRPMIGPPPPPVPQPKIKNSSLESKDSINDENSVLETFKKSAKWNELGDTGKRDLESAIKDGRYDDMNSVEEADFIVGHLVEEQQYELMYGDVDKKYDDAAIQLLSESSDVFSGEEKRMLKPAGMTNKDLVEYMRFYNGNEGPEWVTLFHATTDIKSITSGIDPKKLTSEGLGSTKGEAPSTFFLTPDYEVAKGYLKQYRQMGKGKEAGIVAVRVRRNDPSGTAEGEELRLRNAMTQDMFNKLKEDEKQNSRVNILWIKPLIQ